MTLEPLLDASPAIQIHVATVIPAALLGAFILLHRKGTPLHRLLGKIWMALMVVTALTSFFIHEIKMFFGFSPIHLLSAATIFGAWQAIAAARRHDVATHRRIVRPIYFGGIIIAGGFTLVPGRIMNEVVFSGHDMVALVFGLLVAGAAAAIVLSARVQRAA
ncbi:DUF2306 domain-containing protein [Rhizobium sp. OAE497]|uniref:DUF2306 domain-containing protein n=1 Tax=Rhizobium sp. OAE497 TaxID=2663796 RepID=UPI0018F5AE50